MALRILLGGRLTIIESNFDDIRKPTCTQCKSILTKYIIILYCMFILLSMGLSNYLEPRSPSIRPAKQILPTQVATL